MQYGVHSCTQDMIFSVTYYQKLRNGIIVYCAPHCLPTIVELVVWTLQNINIFTWQINNKKIQEHVTPNDIHHSLCNVAQTQMGLKWFITSSSPLLLGYGTHVQYKMVSKLVLRPQRLPRGLWRYLSILFTIKINLLTLIMWSYRSSPIILIVVCIHFVDQMFLLQKP